MEKTSYSQNDYAALLGSNIPKALVEDKSMRFDDAEDASVFFARELDHVKAQSYDVVYPELYGAHAVPDFQRSQSRRGNRYLLQLR